MEQRRRFAREFKLEAVELVRERGVSVGARSRRAREYAAQVGQGVRG
jgi:transposase-like protein